jgi:LysR family transcriptional regulator, glycine cleavage system transcriptional activator
MDSKIPVNWLRVFEVAARHQSLSAAAAELNVTPAAVSQQVRLLEHRLGEKLFVRHARGLRLTLAGEALLPACRESFERLDSALTELFGQRRSEQLVVRVTLGFARQWLLDKLAGFSRRHPRLPIRLVASVWDSNPVDSSVDLDIRLASGPVPGMESHVLTQDEIFPVCSPALAVRKPRLRRPEDLAHRALLSTIGFAQGWRHWFAAAGVRDDIPTSCLEFDSMRLTLETASLGHGVALARSSYADDLLRRRHLKRLFDVELTATDNVYLSHARGLDARTPAAQFRDWLLDRPLRRNDAARGDAPRSN